MILKQLYKSKLIQPPEWLSDNCHYLVMHGSHAYRVNTLESDYDIYGFCIPPKSIVFPHLAGFIEDFSKSIPRFQQWSQHHIKYKESEWDFSIYNIVRYFRLLMENNPNIVDSLFVDQDCILHCTQIGNMVRESRKEFLHKGCWHKLKGYAYSQLHKMTSMEREGARKEMVEKYGYDLKFAYHVLRLLDQADCILSTGDLVLGRNKEQLKAIRRGDMSVEEIKNIAAAQEKRLEELYHNSKLQYGPDENKLKNLLLQCLEHHYGSISECVQKTGWAEDAIKEIKQIIDEVSNKI